MVNIINRMRVLRELLWIRTGPGALILPKEVTKISMEFNARIEGGHRGARKFWKNMLPRIKYRNPSIPMQVTRHKDKHGPSLLHIYTSSSPSATTTTDSASNLSTPPSGTPNAQTTLTPDTSPPTHTIECRMLSESQILELLVEKTNPTVLEMTEEETQQWADIEEFKIRSEKDRQEVSEKLFKIRREEELLRMARGEAAASS